VTDAENPVSVALKIEELLPLVSARTRLVAFDVVRAVRTKATEVGAKKVETCVDCVAYAPHRLIDVRAWDVDYCFFSYYKVNGLIYRDRICG
jgi:selenocysteine lyase/cysteine desulfurase